MALPLIHVYVVKYPEGKCYEIIHVLSMNVYVMNLKKTLEMSLIR